MALVLNGSGSITGVTDLATAGVALEDAALTDPVVTGGIYLGGTGAANHLDDYEEGEWTPTLTGTTGGPSGVNYSYRYGNYVKVGRLVHVTCHISLSSWSSGPSGNAQITGLPFTAESASGSNYGGFAIGFAKYFSSTATPCGAYVEPNSTVIRLITKASADARDELDVSVPAATLDGNELLIFSGTYYANA